MTLNEGKFSKAVVRGETVTLKLEPYTGTSGTAALPHVFTVTDDTDGVATKVHGEAPSFTYTADNDAVVDFLDESTVGVSARLVHGAPQITAKYVNGLPVVVRVGRCGWQSWGWTLGGEATFESELVGGDLVGTKVEVAVSISQVQEQDLPELDDEFAQLASEFDTADELVADVDTPAPIVF